MNEKTATQIRLDADKARLSYSMLRADPQAQAEAIARHYIAHAQMALQIVKLLDAKKIIGDPNPAIDEIVEFQVKQIKANHWADFGIALEWPALREEYLNRFQKGMAQP